jgi:hypothetical protein
MASSFKSSTNFSREDLFSPINFEVLNFIFERYWSKFDSNYSLPLEAVNLSITSAVTEKLMSFISTLPLTICRVQKLVF